jgi:Skp family chaperone for outer membrane proteins
MKMHAIKVLSGMMLVSGAAAMASEIGYIDMNKVASEYHLAISKSDALTATREKMINEINARAKDLQATKIKAATMEQAAKEAKEANDRQTFVEGARENQLKALRQEAELKEYVNAQDADFKAQFGKVRTAVLDDVDAKLAVFAKEKKLDAIADVSGRAFPYYDKDKNVTDEFLKKINVGHEAEVTKAIEKRKKDAEKAAATDSTTAALNAADALLNKTAEEKKTAAPVAPATK